jgi:hypothetical protein
LEAAGEGEPEAEARGEQADGVEGGPGGLGPGRAAHALDPIGTGLEGGGVVLYTPPMPVSTPVRVDYTTVDGSAKAGRDYEASSGTLTFAPGGDGEDDRGPRLRLELG